MYSPSSPGNSSGLSTTVLGVGTTKGGSVSGAFCDGWYHAASALSLVVFFRSCILNTWTFSSSLFFSLGWYAGAWALSTVLLGVGEEDCFLLRPRFSLLSNRAFLLSLNSCCNRLTLATADCSTACSGLFRSANMAYLFSPCSVRIFLTQGGTTMDDGGDRGACTSFNSLLLLLGALALNPTPIIHSFLPPPPPRRFLLLRGRSSSALLVAFVFTHSFMSVNSSSVYGTWSYFSLQLSRQKSITW
mmetsp:Transcript_21332/g.32961  ORF Transcript_21332/g.32961 Transcript_21332/m.32961 type:complete len:245 (-) Transcript_21332:4851-5585(-)